MDSASINRFDTSDYSSQFVENFKPIKVLGQGGYGVVFAAEKHLMGKLNIRTAAVKRISFKKGDAEEALKEVGAFLKLDHEGIVKFYDAWTEHPPARWQRAADENLLRELKSDEVFTYKDDFLYIQMELCQSSLSEWLSQNEQRDQNQINIWFKQIVSAVEYIHSMNFIHRDLKPSNVLLTIENKIKVCDLGIMTDRVVSNDDGGEEVAVERTYGRGTTMYMAPEQMGWEEYSSKVDIFALGLILTEMCIFLTIDQAQQVFNDYRTGKANNVLQHLPDAKELVMLMTNPIDIQRPDCKTILRDDFFMSEYMKERLAYFRSRDIRVGEPSADMRRIRDRFVSGLARKNDESGPSTSQQ